MIRRVHRTYDTGSEVVGVGTDTGDGFAKFKGGGEGPHVLACEWIGTHLARSMGLPVFDFALIDYDGIPKIVFPSGRTAEKGTAWLTRKVEGIPWNGMEADLRHLANRGDLAKLVLLDQWTKNCDRYRPESPTKPKRANLNNVFLGREAPPGQFMLMAIDHTHILTCGSAITPRITDIGSVRDPLAYGLFPEFVPHLRRSDAITAVSAMNAIEDREIRDIVAGIPVDWDVEASVKEKVVDFLLDRRAWLANQFVSGLFPQEELDLQ